MPALLAGQLTVDNSLHGAPGDIPNEPTGLARILSPMRRRGLRVATLLVLTCLLSLTDLALTMTYVKGFGMFEGNPVVLKLIGSSSPLAMITWKLLTTVIAMTILFTQRSRWQAEAAAILGFLVYSGLLVHWNNYINEIHEHTSALSIMAHESEHGPSDLGPGSGFRPGEAWVTYTD